jgi:hypothetical protein
MACVCDNRDDSCHEKKEAMVGGLAIGRSMSLTDSSARHQHTQHRLTQSICSRKLMVAEKTLRSTMPKFPWALR